MQIQVQGLSLSVGYRGDWHAKVPDPTPARLLALKQASRALMRAEYGWLNGPVLDISAYQQAMDDLARAFNEGDGRLDDQEVKAACERFIRAKQPAAVKGTYQVVVDPDDSYGECFPNPSPPPFWWRDTHALNLIGPDGKRASVLAEADGVQVKVKLVVLLAWEVPEA